ncbi:hypothetical protein ACTGZQ_08060 [Streptococcus suis]
MSVLKKILSILLILVFVIIIFVFHHHHQQSVKLETALRNDNKIEALYYLTTFDRYANAVREKGYVIIPDSPLQIDTSGYSLEIGDKLSLKVRYISQKDNNITLDFTTNIANKNTDIVYTLDNNLNLVDSSYYQLDEQNVKKTVAIQESEEKRLLSIVQKEINGFLDTMEETLYNQ